MTKSEFQCVFDSVCNAIENAGFSLSEGNGNEVYAETDEGFSVKITIDRA